MNKLPMSGFPTANPFSLGQRAFVVCGPDKSVIRRCAFLRTEPPGKSNGSRFIFNRGPMGTLSSIDLCVVPKLVQPFGGFPGKLRHDLNTVDMPARLNEVRH